MNRGHAAVESDAAQNQDVMPSATSARRFAGLDGLRALAAIAIIFHHVGFDSGATYRQPMTHFLGRADIGVPVFFVLSGFLLYRPFAARMFDGGVAPDTRLFWAKRVLRVYPAFWVATIIMLLTGGIAVRGPIGFFFSATLTHSYHLRRAISGITQSWTLVTEIAFYFFLPLWHRFMIRLGRNHDVNGRATVALIGIAAVYLSSVLFRMVIALTRPQFWFITPQWFLSQSDIFALGMLLAVGHTWAEHNPAVASLLASTSRRIVLWYLGAAAAFWFMATQLELVVGLDTAGAAREALRQFFYGIIAFAVVMPIAWGGGATSRIGRVLSSRVLTYLGTVSYGIYLWHQWVFVKIRQLLGWEIFTGHFWILVVGALMGSTAIAALSHRFVEQPLMRLAPRLARIGR